MAPAEACSRNAPRTDFPPVTTHGQSVIFCKATHYILNSAHAEASLPQRHKPSAPTTMAPRAGSEKRKCIQGHSGPLMAFLAACKAEMAASMGHDLATPASHDTAEYRASWSYNADMKDRTVELCHGVAAAHAKWEKGVVQKNRQSWLQRMLCNASAACASRKHARRATTTLAMPSLTATYALGSRAL